MSKNDKTITDKMNDLTTLVAWFEGDDFELEKALDTYKEAEKLAGEIEHDLSELKNEVTILKKKFDA